MSDREESTGRIPPHDMHAEREVLGGMLLEPSSVAVVQAVGLEPASFYRDAHALIFECMLELHAAGVPIDTVTLRERLATGNKLMRVGGDEYLLGLGDTLPTAQNVRAHAEIVLGKSALRRVIHALHEGAAKGYAGNLEDAREAARQALDVRESEAITVLSASDVAMIAANPRGNRQGVVRTGYGLIDGAIRAMPAATMLTIGGATGCGKSTLMLGFAINAAKLRPAIVSIEDAEDVWGARVIAQLVPSVSQDTLISQQADLYNRAEVENGIRLARSMGVHFHFALNRPLKDVVRAVRTLCSRGHRLIFVDYLQAIMLGGTGAKRAELVSHAAQTLKSTCQEYGSVLVLGSQLSRPDNNKPFAEPHAYRLKESGDLENMSDAIVLLWKPSDADSAPILGKVAKVKWSARRPRFQFEMFENGALNNMIPVQHHEQSAQDDGGWGRRRGRS